MMTRKIVLHQFNAPEASLVDLIAVASANGCDAVSIFGFNGATVLPARNARLAYPQAVTAENRREVMQALCDRGVSLDGIEFFPITADVDFDIYQPALAQAREMGAKRVVSHIFIEDDAHVVDRLGHFCELAGAEGLKVSTEFCPMTPGNPSLARAKWLVDRVGAANFGIGFDVLHLIRSGGSPADVAGLDPRYIAAVQICDAQGAHASDDYMTDVHNREVPGRGDLPIREFLNAVPASFPIEVEVPAAHRRAAGVTTVEHVRDVVTAARAIIETLGRA